MRYLLILGFLLAISVGWLLFELPKSGKEGSFLQADHTEGFTTQRSKQLALANPALPAREEVDAEIPWSEPMSSAPKPSPSRSAKDKVETGECRLELSFASLQAGKSVGGKVDLWRIDAPGNFRWSRGDQLQTSLQVRSGKAVVEGLPEGWFRTHELFARAGSAPSEAFYVKGPVTKVQHIIDLPMEERVSLVLVLPSGVVIDGSEQPALQIRPNGWSGIHSAEVKPAWLTKRHGKSGEESNIIAMGGGGGMRSGTRWADLDWMDGAISLGTMQGADRLMAKHHSFKLRWGTGPAVTVDVRPVGVGQYVAILPDPGAVFARLELSPELAEPLTPGDLWITSTAVPVDFAQGQTAQSEWMVCVSELRLWGDRIESLTQAWNPAKGPMPWTRVEAKVPDLVPAPPTDEDLIRSSEAALRIFRAEFEGNVDLDPGETSDE